MGIRDRLRMRRILGGIEGPMPGKGSVPDRYQDPKEVAPPGTVSKAETMARKVVEKTLAPKWAKMSLVGQVAICRNMVRAMGVDAFRVRFMPGFDDDLRDKLVSGAVPDEIVAYYMDCPQFVDFWKSLGHDETYFRSMVGNIVESMVVTRS